EGRPFPGSPRGPPISDVPEGGRWPPARGFARRRAVSLARPALRRSRSPRQAQPPPSHPLRRCSRVSRGGWRRWGGEHLAERCAAPLHAGVGLAARRGARPPPLAPLHIPRRIAERGPRAPRSVPPSSALACRRRQGTAHRRKREARAAV
ncbi:hypothetical protein T484DRAFT_1902150, partial [Baffinella frigidus]